MAMKSRDGDKTLIPDRGYLYEKNSIGEAFVGQVLPWRDNNSAVVTARTTISTDSLEGVSVELHRDYANKAIMSLDGLIRPVSMDRDGGLPGFILATITNNEPIQLEDLIPFTNPSGVGFRTWVAEQRSDTPTIGHDIEILARTGSVEGTPEWGLIIPPTQVGVNSPDYQEDYRGFALRGPVIIQGWGYDVDDIPVPNKNDSATSASFGSFIKNPHSLNKTKFLDGHLRQSRTWAVAPLDIRLDKHRGIWTAGDRILKARNRTKINQNGSGIVDIYKVGSKLTGTTKTAHYNWMTKSGSAIDAGTDLFIYYFADEQKWVIIGADCGSSNEPEGILPIEGEPWTPIELSGELSCWYNSFHPSVDESFLNGVPVNTWYDISGNGFDASIPIFTFTAPIYQSSVLNGKSGLYFDESVLTVPSGVMLLSDSSSSMSLFCLCYLVDSTNEENLILNTNSKQLTLEVNSTSGDLSYYGVGDHSGYMDGTDNFTFIYPQLISMVYDGTSSKYWVNGVNGGSEYSGSTDFTENLFLGGAEFSGIQNSITGWLFEFIILHSGVSEDDRQKLEGYIMHNYQTNLLLPTGHPYYGFAPEL